MLIRTLIGIIALLMVAGGKPAQAEVGVTDDTIVVGCSNSFSGPLAYTGTQLTKFGLDLYFKWINDQGGINGRKVKTIYYDDGYRPQDALANTKKLVEQDKVFAILAPQGTAPILATVDYLLESKVPLLFPFQGADVLSGKRLIFTSFTLYPLQSKLMVDYLVEKRKMTKFASIYQDDEYGKSFLRGFEGNLDRYKLKLVAAESVKRGAIDLSAQVAKVRQAKPDAVFLILTPGPGAQVLKEAAKVGWKDSVLVSSGPLTDENFIILGAGVGEGVEGLSLWPDPVHSEQPAIKKYREILEKYAPGNKPNRYSLFGYFYAMLFTEGVKRAGKDLTREGLIKALEGIKNWENGIIPPVSFSETNHETQRGGFWVRVEGGVFKPVSDWFFAN